jgi:hypothetical protein
MGGACHTGVILLPNQSSQSQFANPVLIGNANRVFLLLSRPLGGQQQAPIIGFDNVHIGILSIKRVIIRLKAGTSQRLTADFI